MDATPETVGRRCGMNGSEAIIAIIWLWVVVILIAVAGIQ